MNFWAAVNSTGIGEIFRATVMRARRVRKALAPPLEGSGITLVTAGHGAAQPVAPNTVTVHGRVVDNPKGRSRNRRTELTVPR